MQKFQTMTCTEWLQACFSPQLEPSAGLAVNGGPNDRPADLKVIIHFDQSQVSLQLSAADTKKPLSLSLMELLMVDENKLHVNLFVMEKDRNSHCNLISSSCDADDDLLNVFHL